MEPWERGYTISQSESKQRWAWMSEVAKSGVRVLRCSNPSKNEKKKKNTRNIDCGDIRLAIRRCMYNFYLNT